MSHDARVLAPEPGQSKGLLLRVDGLTTEFPAGKKSVRAVNGVTLALYKGDILGIVGESGSGKSVTARSIMRMVQPPGRVTAGDVILGGTHVLSIPEREMRRVRGQKVAMVFQDPQAALNPVMRVGDQLVEAMTIHGMSTAEARERSKTLFEQVGIPDVVNKLKQYPHQFSGGMRQRVVIAIALACQPDLLIADEPTTALDVTIQAQILRLLADLREELGLTIALITHNMGVVAELCTSVAVMYAGRVVERGSVTQVLTHPSHPYTRALLAAMPRLSDPVRHGGLPAIPGSPPDPTNLSPGCAFAPRCSMAAPECTAAPPALIDVAPGQVAACIFAGKDVAPQPEPAVTPEDLVPPSDTTSAPSAGSGLELHDVRVDLGRRRGLFRPAQPAMIVDGVSLSLARGQTLGLVGESGCGKSTLSRALVGINTIASGRVVIDGQDVTAMGDAELHRIRSSVQYLFQDPYASLNPRRTIRQSLMEALAFTTPRQEGEAQAQALMSQVGLRPEHLDRYPRSFSGGQRQRIGIARALARKPSFLILDEPVSALDMSIQAQIINLLDEIQEELQLGYLFIAHDLSVVRHLSDTLAVMYLGRIVEYGPAEAIYTDPKHPYTVALLSSSPEPDPNQNRERIILRGDLPNPADPPSGCRFRTRCPIGPLAFANRRICEQLDPVLTMTSGGQTAACHFPGELHQITPIPSSRRNH